MLKCNPSIGSHSFLSVPFFVSPYHTISSFLLQPDGGREVLDSVETGGGRETSCSILKRFWFSDTIDMISLKNGWKPVVGMVAVQVVFAGMNILYKLMAIRGMDLRVLVAYRHIFGAAFLIPFAFFFERETRPPLTRRILFQSFLCGLFGGTLTQNLYLVAINLTTATFSTATTNLVPAVTFVLAVLTREESLGIRTKEGKAKVAGTLLGIGGAMILTLYKGPEINISHSSVDLLDSSPTPAPAHLGSRDRLIGSLSAVASCFTFATWLIIQSKMSQNYPYPYSSTALMCLMGAIQSTPFAIFMQNSWKDWRLGFNIKLFTVVYVGVVASGMTYTVMTWCIHTKGPVYTSVFNPLLLILVALMGSLLLDEKLHLGSLLGAALIVGGLYLVLWGKRKETNKPVELPVQKCNEPGEVEVTTQTTTGRH
ncbi:WAT1-related protein At1g25270-like [Wolffia australiana]